MRPEQRKMSMPERRIDEMKRIRIHLPDRSQSLWELAETKGVSQRVEYFNIIGRPTHQVAVPWVEERIVHDWGLVFGDGTELRGIDIRHYNFFKNAEKIEKRELAPIKAVGDQLKQNEMEI